MAAQVITFQCIVKNRCGQLLSHSTSRGVWSNGEHNTSLLPVLADAVIELSEGERRTICLRADEAYGFYDPNLVITRLREDLVLGDTLKRGEHIRYRIGDKLMLCRIIAADAHCVTMDANHPFAGQDLIFEIEATKSRIASPDEIVESDDSREYFH